MNNEPRALDRRSFIKTAAIGVGAVTLPWSMSAATPGAKEQKFCAFEKPLTFLKHGEMADFIAEAGYDGIEAAVRPRGRVEPERVEEDLPKLVDELKKRGLEVTILTSGISSVNQPHTEKVLRTAAKLGIKRYRMLWHRYDQNKPIMAQMEALRPVFRDLAQMNREIGISGLYQNHSGAYMVGASVWDAYLIVKDLDPQYMGLAYDIRHAQVEAGTCWPAQFDLARSHITAVCVKDFEWTTRGAPGKPLGEGRVDNNVVKKLVHSQFTGPYSVHVEYLGSGAGREECAKAFKQDLQKLREWLRA
jgi:sugar phosphate isomerase/epimerase